MTDKLDKMKNSLSKNLPVKDKLPKVVIDKDIKDDYEFSRETYKNLIKVGTMSLETLTETISEKSKLRSEKELSESEMSVVSGGGYSKSSKRYSGSRSIKSNKT